MSEIDEEVIKNVETLIRKKSEITMYCNQETKVELTVKEIKDIHSSLDWAISMIGQMTATEKIWPGEGVAYNCSKGTLRRFGEKYNKYIKSVHVEG